MAEDKIALQQLPNDEHGERFQIIFIDGEQLAVKPGYFRETRGPMTEAEVRAFFERGHQPSSDVEAMFRLAREAFAKG